MASRRGTARVCSLPGLISVGSLLLLAHPSFAASIDDNSRSLLRNQRLATELRSRANQPATSAAADTTFIGFTPGHSGDNYWSVWSGNNAIGGTWNRPPARGGLWDFEPPYAAVHGDSLQGWWSLRFHYGFTGGV